MPMDSPEIIALAKRAAPFSISRTDDGGGMSPRKVGFRKFSASSIDLNCDSIDAGRHGPRVRPFEYARKQSMWTV